MANTNLKIPNTQVGMKIKLFREWDIFGGYEHKGNKNIFIVKQTNTDDQDKGVSVSDFVNYFVETINGFTNADIKLEIDWPKGIKEIVDALQVYVNQVYFKIEIQTDAKPPDDKDIEYAFWIGIKLSDEIKTAINGEGPYYAITEDSLKRLDSDAKLDKTIFSENGLAKLREKKGHAPKVEEDFKKLLEKNIFKAAQKELPKEFLNDMKFEVPPIFKIIQLEDLFIKIWDTSHSDIIKELQLESLIDRYGKLKLITEGAGKN